MGRPRNAESITICSIGTIRGGIPSGGRTAEHPSECNAERITFISPRRGDRCNASSVIPTLREGVFFSSASKPKFTQPPVLLLTGD